MCQMAILKPLKKAYLRRAIPWHAKMIIPLMDIFLKPKDPKRI